MNARLLYVASLPALERDHSIGLVGWVAPRQAAWAGVVAGRRWHSPVAPVAVRQLAQRRLQVSRGAQWAHLGVNCGDHSICRRVSGSRGALAHLVLWGMWTRPRARGVGASSEQGSTARPLIQAQSAKPPSAREAVRACLFLCPSRQSGSWPVAESLSLWSARHSCGSGPCSAALGRAQIAEGDSGDRVCGRPSSWIESRRRCWETGPGTGPVSTTERSGSDRRRRRDEFAWQAERGVKLVCSSRTE